MLKLSIVVPTHRRSNSLFDLLESIENQSLFRELFEVLIISNFKESYLGKPEFKERWKNLNLKTHVVGRKGVNRARNCGLRKTNAPIVLFLDDDCFLSDGEFFEKVLLAHLNFPEAAAIGGCYEVEREAGAIDKAYNCLSRHWQALDSYGEYKSTRLVGGNVSYKRKFLSSPDFYFNENIQFGATEAEFHKRLEANGRLCLFLDSLVVFHRTHLAASDLVRKAIRQAHGHIKYKIEEGFSREHYSTFQPHRLLRARLLAKNSNEMEEILKNITLYDHAYQLACQEPSLDEGKAMKRIFKEASKKWNVGVGL